MGTSCYFGCQDCGWDLELREGVGILFSNPKRLLQMVAGPEGEQAAELLENQNAVVDELAFWFFSCRDCGALESRLNFQISLGENQVYKSEHLSSQCGGLLEPVGEFHLLENCPECGSRKLMTGMGEWD